MIVGGNGGVLDGPLNSFGGRQRFAKIAYIDFGYYIESSTKTGISDLILASNPTVVNGAQLPNIPLHQATISLDVETSDQ